MRILFVCTANRCRSVMAEALARSVFPERGYEFASAGLQGGGLPTPPHGIAVARERGIDLSDHASRAVDREGLRNWDVILTMTREHSRELVAADPALWPRTFTLPQFRRWIERHPRDGARPLGEWIDDAGADRPRLELIGADAADDIADPVAGPKRDWRRLVARLTDDLEAIATALGEPVATEPAQPAIHPATRDPKSAPSKS